MRFALLLALTASTASAQTCEIDLSAVETRIAGLEPSYGLVLSDISCDAPTNPAHILMCNDANAADATLWRMGRLDDLAWLYPANPPRDDSFIATRDACTDATCLCETLIEHTNASLGGTSPYPQ